MATTFSLKIADGSISAISLVNTASTGIIGAQGGFGPTRIPNNLLMGGRIAETYVLDLKGSSHDNAASTIQSLVKMLKMARDYHAATWQPAPVYIEAQTSGETNKRYAVVYTAVEMEIPDLFDTMFATNYLLEEFKITIIREHPWRSGVPHTEGSAIALGASDGPSSPTKVAVANFRDDITVTHVFVDDGGVFGSNIISASTGTALFPAVPVANDNLYIGSDNGPFKNVVIDVATAGNHVWVVELEYWDGADWDTVTTFGTDYSIYHEGAEVASEDSIFEGSGQWMISIHPFSDWASTTVNSQAAHWIRLRLSTVTSTTTVPTKSDDAIYAQRKNYVEVPAASILGDAPPLSIIRIHAPSGGGSTVGPCNLSRILIGSKSEHGGVSLATFEPFLNLGNVDNPAAWTTSYGTDSSSVADVQAPGNAHCAVSFATDATMVKRVTLLGDDILDDYEGEYRLLVGVQQIGGSAGDVTIKGRVFVGGTDLTDPHTDTKEKKTRGADDGIEVIDLGLVAFPLTRRHYGDAMASTDIGIEIHLQRTTGTSTMELYYAYLFPVAEGSVGVDDPVADLASGSSALRGGHVLDIDSGIIADRTVKYIYDGTNLVPTEEWARFNRPIEFFNLGKKTRLYFLLETYSDNGWNREPLVAGLGNAVMVEVFMHYSYNILRGAV